MKIVANTLITASFLWVSSPPAHAFDRATTNALKACHDYIWMEVPEFNKLPNAAVSVFPGVVNDNSITVFWNVMWDDPIVRAAGNCTSMNGVVEGFEDYTKIE
ncbi:hypothetical protein [Shimia thalassica]|uniref:hypothetical protein n=1 Tax=Shimia thalassica TaxID=1715693 RepID=UPI000C071798|nr:hypothetical protein [Shimia thalassica]MDO6485130.1 hypothetical protein [Shimia thalassica]PHO03216.1 hypothetical protein CSC82_15010 [Rhodobacteraceae bacterium 4F10]